MRVTPNCDSINSFYICNATGAQDEPDIAFGSGYYFVVWSDPRYGNYRIYGARVTPAGTVMEPNGFLVCYGTSLYNYHPSVIFNGTNFFVTWYSSSSPYRIMGRFVNPDGSFGSDTLKIVECLNNVYKIRIAFDGTNYLLVWIVYNSSTNTYSLKGVRVSNAGVPIGSIFSIADSVLYYGSLSVRYAFSRYLVVFSKQIGSYYQHCGRYYNTLGQPIGGIFNISNAYNNCVYGDVYPGANNTYLNVFSLYNINNYDIYGNLDVTVGIEEQENGFKKNTGLQSTVVSNAIEFRDKRVSGVVYDIAGKFIGDLKNGYFDCRTLPVGVYIVMTNRGEVHRVIKLK